MSDAYPIDDERAVMITRNIGLAFEMLHELLANPEHIEGLPGKASVFVVPPDDPEFARHQMERVQPCAADGYRAVVWRLGATEGERRAIPLFDPTVDTATAFGVDAA